MTIFRTHTSGAVRAVAVAAAAVALLASASVAVADQRSDHQQGAAWGHDQGASHHWQRGERMGQNDWTGAQPVDYRAHHLRQPPRGYEWRQSNGQYVLAAVASGLIASVILSH
jgi:Ni/Co efflux regulator RcnB